MRLGNAKIDLEAGVVSHPDWTAQLTDREVQILEYVSKNGALVTRTQLEHDVWNFAAGVLSEAVPVAMRRLHKKLGPQALAVVRGTGWRFRTPTSASPRTLAIRGRKTLLTSIGHHFQEDHRVVLLHGPAGIGKTHLARAFAQAWNDGWLWCDGSSHPDSSGLLDVIGSQLDLVGITFDSVTQALDPSRPPLLVIDHVDPSDEIRTFLTEILARRSSQPILITSTVAFDHPNLVRVQVPRLDETTAGTWVRDGLSSTGVPFSASDVQDLVRLCDGYPAVLERLPGLAMLGVPHLLKQLDDGHPSWLRTALHQAWLGLKAPGRAALLRCVAMGGVCTLDAAVELGADFETLDELRAQSWLHTNRVGELEVWPSTRVFCEAQPEIHAARAVVVDWVLERVRSELTHQHTHPGRTAERLRSYRFALERITWLPDHNRAADAACLLATCDHRTGPYAMAYKALVRVSMRPLDEPTRARVELWRGHFYYNSGRGVPEFIRGRSEPIALFVFTRGLRTDTAAMQQAFDRLTEVANNKQSSDYIVASANLNIVRFLRSLMEPEEVRRRLSELRVSAVRFRLLFAEFLAVESAWLQSQGDLPGAHRALDGAMAIAQQEQLYVLQAHLWNTRCGLTFDTDWIRCLDAAQSSLRVADQYGVINWRNMALANIVLLTFVTDQPDKGRNAMKRLIAANPPWPVFVAFLNLLLDVSDGRVDVAHIALFDWIGLGSFLSSRGLEHGNLMKDVVLAEMQRHHLLDGDPATCEQTRALVNRAQPEAQVAHHRTLRMLVEHLRLALPEASA